MVSQRVGDPRLEAEDIGISFRPQPSISNRFRFQVPCFRPEGVKPNLELLKILIHLPAILAGAGPDATRISRVNRCV